MARKKNKYFKPFLILTVLSALFFAVYIGILWWRSQQLEMVQYPEFGIAVPEGYSIHGIDVSRYQQSISWESVQQMEVRHIKMGFAFMKATEGINNTDAYFKQNWRRSRKAGMVRGAYHFFIASKDARKQAQNYIDRVELVSGDLPPVLDIEQTFGVSPDQLRKQMRIWLDEIERYYNVKPVIYTYVDFYSQYLQGYFDDYPLWIAHYLQPHQPRINRDWTFWQHSEGGHVNGILSRVDFDVFNGDSTAFRALLIP